MLEGFDTLSAAEHDRRLRRLAEIALRKWGVVANSLTMLQHEDNAVFEVSAESGHWALRVGAENGCSLREQEEEMSWLSALRAGGLCVPEPMLTLDGETVTMVDVPDLLSERSCVLFRWVPGDPPTPGASLDVVRRVGALAAKVHAIGEVFARGRTWNRPDWSFERVCGTSSMAGAVDVIGAPAQSVVEAAKTLLMPRMDADRCRAGSWGLIHGDLHRDNILVARGAVGFIDFDDCGTGALMMDLATAIESFSRRLARSSEERVQLRDALLSGYDELRALPADVDAALRDYVAARQLSELNFIVASTNPVVRSWGPERVAEIVRSLERYIHDR
jgi:Ser/Thr protein kinase RdoA (MazF antagonist)